MSERVRMAGFGEGAPENEQLIEAVARLSREARMSRGPLTPSWNDDRTLIFLHNEKGRIEMVINPDDFVALGGTLP